MDLYGLRADTNENLLVTKAVQNSHSYVQTYITGISFPREVRRSCLVELERKSIRRFVITEKAPTRAFSWLKAATTAFTFKTPLRHYAKQALTPRSLNVKLGPRRKGHKGRAVWLA